MDWNWLFSSMAQAFAAIVGIFGGFIITKVLSNQVAFEATKVRLRAVLVEARKLSEDADARYVEWYNDRTEENALHRASEKIRKGAGDDAITLLDGVGFSPFEPRDTSLAKLQALIDDIRDTKLKQEQRYRDEAAFMRQHLSPGTGWASSLEPEIGRIPTNAGLGEEINDERDAILLVMRESRRHARTVHDLLEIVRPNPESSWQITWVLVLVIVLFFIGVIYPLSFMPLPVGRAPVLSLSAVIPTLLSLKGVFLAVGSIVFCVIVAMFFAINSRLLYPGDLLAELKPYSDVAGYSHYFAVYDANVAAKQAAATLAKAADQASLAPQT